MGKGEFRVMDSDLHVLEPKDLFDRYLDDAFQHRVKRRAPYMLGSTGYGAWSIDGHEFPPYSGTERYQRRYDGLHKGHKEALTNVLGSSEFNSQSTLRAMDLEGVDVAALYRSFGGMIAIGLDDLDDDFAFALARAHSNWLSDFCSADPERMRGVACIPLGNAEMAVEETRRVVEELGFVGITVHPEPVNGRLPWDRELDPLWAECERLNISVGFHGTSLAPSREDITHKYFNHPIGGTLSHAISFPTQVMASMGGMIMSGVFERFPTLRVAFLEGTCGWLPWWLYRMDDQWAKYGPHEQEGQLSLRPSDYFLRNCFIAMDPDEAHVADVIRRVGDDNIIISTDYPHPDSAFPHAMDEFLELDLPRETQRKILWDNCARLYGIGA